MALRNHPHRSLVWPAQSIAQPSMGKRQTSSVVAVMATVMPRADYHAGDFIPTARKGQFQGTRTQWHDLIGRHCPRFAQDRTVMLPLPRPVGYLGEGGV